MEAITLLRGKKLILGVTGSIAVYKAVDLASKLTQAGAAVDVIMTDAAQRFVTPITFQSVTGRPVYTSMWHSDNSGALPTHIAHVGLGEGADLMVVAPITANSLAKLAQGMASDLLSVTALAMRCPVIAAPAMDGGMYEHPATQRNIRILVEQGVTLIEPEEGRFASGFVGKGRFPDTSVLIGYIRSALGRVGELARRKVVVTAGGTREALDPVRYITNHSSGKQGYALAQAAIDAGADVTLISTTIDLPTPISAKLIRVNSAQEMLNAVQEHIPHADVLLMAAAVADFRPETSAQHKIKKTDTAEQGMTLSLVRNPDILLEIKAFRNAQAWPRVTVGFAAESQDLLKNAQSKLKRKGLDFIVANDITASDAGFRADTNRVTIISADGKQHSLELASKALISEAIIEHVAAQLT